MIPPAWEGLAAWPRVARTIAMMHLGSAVLCLIGVGLWALWSQIPADERWHGENILLSLMFAGFLIYALVTIVVETVVVAGLRQRKGWAWTAGLVVLAMDAGSILFVPMTIVGLINLLHPDVRAAFDAPPAEPGRDELPDPSARDR